MKPIQTNSAKHFHSKKILSNSQSLNSEGKWSLPVRSTLKNGNAQISKRTWSETLVRCCSVPSNSVVDLKNGHLIRLIEQTFKSAYSFHLKALPGSTGVSSSWWLDHSSMIKLLKILNITRVIYVELKFLASIMTSQQSDKCHFEILKQNLVYKTRHKQN